MSNYPDAHSMNIIQIIHKPSNITAETELVCHPIMLKHRTVRLIVGWVAIEVSINCLDHKRESPILWRWVVSVIIPLAPIIDWMDGGLILVDVIPDMLGSPPKSCNSSG